MVPIGFLFGHIAERRHLRSLEERERRFAGLPVTDLKSFPGLAVGGPTPQIFFGEVCIASDYYKTFAGGLRNFFGGEMKSYRSLMTRARREAVLRIIEQAAAAGFNAVGNVRLETADITGSAVQAKRGVSVTVLATATAYRIDG